MDGASSGGETGLPLRELETQITQLAGHLNAATYRWLTLIAEFDRRKGWSDSVTQSCAHWLNWKCGLDIGAAREKVRVAHALAKLPRISAAMANGTLSYAKVRAVTRVACPETEEILLSVALHGTAHHVETLVRQFRRVREVDELAREARQHANRRLTYSYDVDGSLIVKAQLPAETGALLLCALEAALADLPLPDTNIVDVAAETSGEKLPPLSARRADALGILAESFLKHGAEALNGGERHHIVIHVDEATLKARESGRCEIDEGPAIPIESARRMSCDASTVRIMEVERGEPLDVGRKTRTIPPALRRALNSRDRGCVFPGCTHKRYVDGHHIHHWSEGGETKLSNLVTLCRFHHRAVHEGGIKVERLDDGAWRFTKADGHTLHSGAPGCTQPLGDWTVLRESNCEGGINIDANTAATGWRGERMDYGIAIDALLRRSQGSHGSTNCDDVPNGFDA
jgi:hypothetical protein